MSNELGDRLRDERKRIGVSQADAALLTGVSREMWGRYERGAMPSSEVLLHAMTHGFDVNYILGGSRTLSDSTLTEEEEAVIAAYRSTDGEGRAAISRSARMEQQRVAPAAKRKTPPR